MSFTREADFEQALIHVLTEKYGWDKQVLHNPTAQDLLDNWADILYQNNSGIDQLNHCPLTEGEKQQLIDQINALRTPLRLNGFINGKTVSIRRDNPDDTLHFGKEVTLKIYDRMEIAAGQSRYQIAEQPQFPTPNPILNNRRGDLMLLINGMPVYHIELKRSGIPISQATCQIEKYAREGVFCGIFALVQVFVAMTPEETLYFANPGPDGRFNKDFYFHWADFNNDPVNQWTAIAELLLSIPMAHKVIGFFTVADKADGVLKALRSYQTFAVQRICDRVSKHRWREDDQRGGHTWHTTGSGKTLSSFKAAQLIAESGDADKVVFLMDRIELGTQSAGEYRSFSDDADDTRPEDSAIQETRDSEALLAKLNSPDEKYTLIVTSIQKAAIIASEPRYTQTIRRINNKRVVFIVDEAHRSTFGDNMLDIKRAFSNALFFGFTGTPIQVENKVHGATTEDVFGPVLHRYTIADGIRDHNVLGFDPCKGQAYQDSDLRRIVAFDQAGTSDIEEIFADPAKEKVFNYYMQLPMLGHTDAAGTYIKGIEDYIPNVQYRTPEYQKAVVENIIREFPVYSHCGKFHTIFATSSIAEAIDYYSLFRSLAPDLKVTAQFDPSIDNTDGYAWKEDGLVAILTDYNGRYGTNYTLANHAQFKKDVASRLAHKNQYVGIERTPEKQVDILIVVDQMLTGFDSKWVNCLCLDKVLDYANLIQAFSRTNRLFGPDKPFGLIRYYRRPYTMEYNIEQAVKLYAEGKPLTLFVDKLLQNIRNINAVYEQIRSLFHTAGITDFATLPAAVADRAKFCTLFRSLNGYIEPARIQGFTWQQHKYTAEENGKKHSVVCLLDEQTYLTLAQRYKEIAAERGEGGGSDDPDDLPYDIDTHLTAIDTGKIDSDYINAHFDRYRQSLEQPNLTPAELQQLLDDLHRSFAMLSQTEQHHAELFLNDVRCGNITLEAGKTFRDYIVQYMTNEKDGYIARLVAATGVDENALRNLMLLSSNGENINEFNRFENLKKTVTDNPDNLQKAKQFFEQKEGCPIPAPRVRQRIDKLLRTFITRDGFDIDAR